MSHYPTRHPKSVNLHNHQTTIPTRPLLPPPLLVAQLGGHRVYVCVNPGVIPPALSTALCLVANTSHFRQNGWIDDDVSRKAIPLVTSPLEAEVISLRIEDSSYAAGASWVSTTSG